MTSIPSIFVLSAGAAVIAVVGFWIVRRVAKPIDLDEHQGFLDAMLSIVGTLVSILLGLLVAASLDHYQSIESSVDAEAADVGQIYRLTAGVPNDVAKNIRELCFEYCATIVSNEWPSMAKGEASQESLHAYMKLIGEIVVFQPKTDGQNNLHNAMIAAMQHIGDCRRQRLLAMRST